MLNRALLIQLGILTSNMMPRVICFFSSVLLLSRDRNIRDSRDKNMFGEKDRDKDIKINVFRVILK
jgi:hypothetical protein